MTRPTWTVPGLAVRSLAVALLMLLSPVGAWADAPRRVLHVSLYPFIPDAPAAALALKQGFERLHPDVIVEVSFNANYYSPNPIDQGVLYEQADIHEIDVVFLRDFLDRHRLAPLSTAFVAGLEPMPPIARRAATQDGHVVAIPHWLCADFLIHRADHAGLDDARTLAALERSLALDHGLLLDMKGDGTLGELYLSALLARDGSPEAAVRHVGDTPDPAILNRMRRLLALEPPGYGRSLDYDLRGSFYARQFARRAGDAFVGYSEMLHEVLDETATSCRHEDRCVTADELRVGAIPFGDERIRPAVWADLFGIDARVHGRTLEDAQAFIRYAVSLPAYRMLLVPEPGRPPRYLLPATENAFADPQILQAAPLYPAFRAILDQGTVVTVPHLNATLQAVARHLDADLQQVR